METTSREKYAKPPIVSETSAIIAQIDTSDEEVAACLQNLETMPGISAGKMIENLIDFHQRHITTGATYRTLADHLILDACVTSAIPSEFIPVFRQPVVDMLVYLDNQIQSLMRYREDKDLFGMVSYNKNDLLIERVTRREICRLPTD